VKENGRHPFQVSHDSSFPRFALFDNVRCGDWQAAPSIVFVDDNDYRLK
jgi:hypothetical protein